MEKKRIALQAAVVGCLILTLTACGGAKGIYVEQSEGGAETEVSGSSAEGGTEEDLAVSGETGAGDSGAEQIYVQVSGAVVHPGVYCLPPGSRVFQAIELAGGTTQEADLTALNQAQPLSDGQMVYVYAVGEEQRVVEDSASCQTDDGKINLNTAAVEELMTLPGIGQSKAESIVAWREENGAFQSVEEIMNITGIKEGVFSKIKDRIKVN